MTLTARCRRCTLSEETLLKALRSSEVGDALASTDTLTDITCHQGYAHGQTHPKQADNAEVVFQYTGGRVDGLPRTYGKRMAYVSTAWPTMGETPEQ